jgi:uroporphyrinogen-III synthase
MLPPPSKSEWKLPGNFERMLAPRFLRTGIETSPGLEGMKVLVTRAPEAAAGTANNLAEAGHEAVVLPVVEYRDVGPEADDRRIASLQFDAIVFTAAAAVPAFARRLAGWRHGGKLMNLPVFCVGAKTRQTAMEAGFADVRPAAGEVISLAGMIRTELMSRGDESAKRILYPAPRDTSQNLAELLVNHDVEELTVYEACLIDPGAVRLAEALGKVAGNAVFVYSSRTGRHLMRLLHDHGLLDRLQSMTLIAISSNVAETLRQSPGVNDMVTIRIADTPDENAMIACLCNRS